MTRPRVATALTIGLVVAVLGVSMMRTNGWTPPSISLPSQTPKAPEDTIYAMMDAARTGDVRAYLDNYAGQLLDQLNESVKESTTPGFVQYLQKTNASVKGVAVSPPQTLASGEAKVRLEYIFKDRNEVQAVYLKDAGSKWKITRIDGAERIKTLVPYGAAVTD